MRQLNSWKRDTSCKDCPHVENILFTDVLNVVFMNSDGQKCRYSSHDFLFVPKDPTIYRENAGAVLLAISSGRISEATSVT